MKTFLADLHIHTVLSPCAEVEMIPPLIVEEALHRGINLIAITDHNASANIRSVQQAAKGTGLVVLPGMELQTREEVHVLCLFAETEQIEDWQKIVSNSLPPIENRIDYFGEQFVVDANGEFIRREPQLLLTSTDLTFDKACQMVHNLGGLFIPAHIDRPAFGLIANLGFVPAGVQVDALEFSRHVNLETALMKFPQVSGFTLIQDGDAHRLNEFLGVNEFLFESPEISEIRLSFRNEAGRSVTVRKLPN
jgi:3',5'-nucleoside bisphosphate phosphatase